MRNRTEFGKTESSTKPKTIKNKYFLIYEGSRTEKIYFEGIIAHKESIGITSLIQLIPLYRNFSEEGRSNPKIILQDTIDYLEKDMNDDTYTPSRLGEMIFSYLEDYGYIKILSFEIKNSIYQSLKQYINEKITKKNGLIVDKLEAITKILNFLENKK